MAKVKFKNVFIAIMGSALALGFLGFIVRVILKVKSGHGLDYYRTGHGVEMNYIGVLIAIAIIPIVLILGWLGNKIYCISKNYFTPRYIKQKKRRK
jgi:hypothetical protein